MEITMTTNDINNFSISELNYIRESIENMNKFNQIEILRILNNRKAILNENKYGVHVNLSELKKESLDDLINYINYVNTQETTLNEVEKQKETFKNIYFTKDNKDKK
jgi:septum formation inhibitor-activating ATPase MinD